MRLIKLLALILPLGTLLYWLVWGEQEPADIFDNSSGTVTLRVDPHDPEGDLIETNGILVTTIGIKSPFLDSVENSIEAMALAIGNADENVEPFEKGVLHERMAAIYEEQNNLDQAIIEYNNALEIYLSASEEFLAAKLLQRLALVTFDPNNVSDAIGYYKKAEELYLASGNPAYAEFVRKIAERLMKRQ